jgi:sulfur relay (sulfurtransferase) DsrF/TusC family protein
LTLAGLDAAMAVGAFGQRVSVLFQGAGVEQLAMAVEPPQGERHVGKTIAGLSLYDVDALYVCASAWARLSTPRTDVAVTPLDGLGQQALIRSAHHVLSF